MKAVVAFVATAAFLVLLLGSLALTGSRVLGEGPQFVVLAASFAPLAVAGYLVALVLLLLLARGRRGARVVAGVCVAGVLLHGAWLLPSYAGERASGSPDLIVLELNARLGQADPDAVVRLVQAQRPDLVVLLETPSELLDALRARGLGVPGGLLPHRGGQPLPEVSGTVVLSAFPLSQVEPVGQVETGVWRMRVGGPRPSWLFAVHTAQPYTSIDSWRRHLRRIEEAQRGLEGPRLLVGDFNATLDHRPMRRILKTGVGDAATMANSGWEPTWPRAGTARFRGIAVPLPLVTIDHVLVSEEFAAVSTQRFKVAGTDHLALVARLRST